LLNPNVQKNIIQKNYWNFQSSFSTNFPCVQKDGFPKLGHNYNLYSYFLNLYGYTYLNHSYNQVVTSMYGKAYPVPLPNDWMWCIILIGKETIMAIQGTLTNASAEVCQSNRACYVSPLRCIAWEIGLLWYKVSAFSCAWPQKAVKWSWYVYI